MGYGYGIKTCRETLIFLSSGENLESRLVKAFSEMGVIQPGDISPSHQKELKEWKERYLSTKKKFVVNGEGALTESNLEAEYRKLSESLVWLCVEIIEHNSRNTKKSDV